MIGRTNAGGGSAAAPVLEEINVTASGVYTPSSGYDGIGKVTASFNESTELTSLRKLIDGSATSLIVPSTWTKVRAYLCWYSSSSTTLVAVDLSNVTTIEQYAFYQCAAMEILRQEIDGVYYFPRQIVAFKDYCLYYAGANKKNTHPYVLHPSSSASIGSYAFSGSNCAKVKGNYTAIGSYAFERSNINEVDITCSGNIGASAFRYCPITRVNIVATGLDSYALNCSSNSNNVLTTVSLKIIGGPIEDNAMESSCYVSSFYLDPTSNVTALGNYAFKGIGAQRSGNSTMTIDFSNSSFITVGSYAFDRHSSSSPCKNMRIVLPDTVGTIGTYAFRGLKDSVVECNSATPPTVSATNTFNNWSNSYLTCPINSINAYRTKANLTTIASYIRGKAFGLSELPELNSEGYELTWYHDVACTNAVTAGETIDPTATYYCTAGATRVAYSITYVELDCTVTPTDTNNHVYTSGDLVRSGTVLTLNVAATDPNKPSAHTLTINGNTFTTGSTITMNDDVSIVAMYWDEVNVPINSTMGQNSWARIKWCYDHGLAPWQVGATKSVTLTDGNTYTVRLADLVDGRYQYSDGTKSTHAAFEFVELLGISGDTTFKMHYGSTSVDLSGGFAATDMKTTLLDQTVYNLLPSDLKDVLEEVVVNISNGNVPASLVPSNCKLFLPSIHEVFSNGTAATYSIDDTSGKGRWQNYTANDNNTYRKKQTLDSTSKACWLRSKISGMGINYFATINTSGSNSGQPADGLCGIAPAFAF